MAATNARINGAALFALALMVVCLSGCGNTTPTGPRKWDPSALCDGKTARARAVWLVQNRGLSNQEAVQKVIEEFPSNFKLLSLIATGKWVPVYSFNYKGKYQMRYGWSRTSSSGGEEPESFGTRAEGLVQAGFDWYSASKTAAVTATSVVAPTAAVAATVVSFVATQVASAISSDWTSGTESHTQIMTYEVPDRGGKIWQWQMNVPLDGFDDVPKLKSGIAMVLDVDDPKPPSCLPGQFVDSSYPHGGCRHTLEFQSFMTLASFQCPIECQECCTKTDEPTFTCIIPKASTPGFQMVGRNCTTAKPRSSDPSSAELQCDFTQIERDQGSSNELGACTSPSNALSV